MGYRKVEREADFEMQLKNARTVLLRWKEHKKDIGLESISKIILGMELEDKENYDSESMLLECLSQVFEIAHPRWIAEFNSLEEHRTESEKKYGMEKINPKNADLYEIISSVVENDDDNTSVLAMNMYLANKIAHAFADTRVVITKKLLSDRNIRGNIKEISETLKMYYKAKGKNSFKEQEQKRRLSKLNIHDDFLLEFEREGIHDLIQAELYTFGVKDHEMMTFINRMKVRSKTQDKEEQLSYGRALDSDGKALLVIDLPYFGQFSLHMRDLDTISALNDTEYSKFVYNVKTVMMVDTASLEVEEDLKMARKKSSGIPSSKQLEKVARARVEQEKNSSEEYIEIETRKYAHHLILKNGGTKKDLDELYDEI